MPDSDTSGTQPLVLRTLRPSERRKVVVGHGTNLLLLALIVRRFRRGSAGAPDRLLLAGFAFTLPLSIAFNIAQLRSTTGKGRYDARDEIILPATLVQRVRILHASEDPSRAAEESLTMIRNELDLNFGDGLLALSTIINADR